MSDKRNLNMITTTVSAPIEPSVIKKVISNATRHELNVCIIDICNRDLNKLFRRNFTDYYTSVDSEGEELDTIHLYGKSGIVN